MRMQIYTLASIVISSCVESGSQSIRKKFSRFVGQVAHKLDLMFVARQEYGIYLE